MTLIQIAASLGVGRSSLVRALAQTPDSPVAPTSSDVGPEQTALQLPEPAAPPAEPAPSPVPQPATAPEIQLLGRTLRRGGDELEQLPWPAGYSPACPICTHPTTGMEEQYARIPGTREPVIVALAQPCGCLVDEHSTALQLGAAALSPAPLP